MQKACYLEEVNLGIRQIQKMRMTDSPDEGGSFGAVLRVVEIVLPHDVVQTCEGMDHRSVDIRIPVTEDITECPDALPVQRPVFGTEFRVEMPTAVTPQPPFHEANKEGINIGFHNQKVKNRKDMFPRIPAERI